MQATKIAFEKRYRDDSGVEFAVRMDGEELELESIDKVSFPISELDWLIDALVRIKAETIFPAQSSPAATSSMSGEK